MGDEASKKHVAHVLKSWGYEVERIAPAEGEKRADLRAWQEAEVTATGIEYVIEAKGRQESEGWRKLLRQAREAGTAAMLREVELSNSVSGVIEQGAKQLRATPAEDTSLRLLWIVTSHGDAEFISACVEKRLYGVETLFCVVVGQDPVRSFDPARALKDCFFYRRDDFSRFREIDAAVISLQDGARLYVNSFSSRRALGRESRLYRGFAERNAVVDPELLEAEGKAFVIGDDFKPTAEGAGQYEYLVRMKNVQTNVVSDHVFTGLAVALRREGDR